jgi:chromosomal replication initiation ATPase DnaA
MAGCMTGFTAPYPGRTVAQVDAVEASRRGRHRSRTPRPALRAETSPYITTAAIRDAVAARYGLRPAAILSRTRGGAISPARHVAIYLATRLTKLSLPAIGERLGGLHHTSVIYAVRGIQQRLRAGEADIRHALDELEAELTGRGL